MWPENDHFGALTLAPEDELMLLRDIFFANLPQGKCTFMIYIVESYITPNLVLNLISWQL